MWKQAAWSMMAMSATRGNRRNRDLAMLRSWRQLFPSGTSGIAFLRPPGTVRHLPVHIASLSGAVGLEWWSGSVRPVRWLVVALTTPRVPPLPPTPPTTQWRWQGRSGPDAGSLVARERWLRLRLDLRVTMLAPKSSRLASMRGGRLTSSVRTMVAHAIICLNWLRHTSCLCRDTQQHLLQPGLVGGPARLPSSVAVYP